MRERSTRVTGLPVKEYLIAPQRHEPVVVSVVIMSVGIILMGCAIDLEENDRKANDFKHQRGLIVMGCKRRLLLAT